MVFSRRFSEGFKFQLLSKGGHAEQNPRKKKCKALADPFAACKSLKEPQKNLETMMTPD